MTEAEPELKCAVLYISQRQILAFFYIKNDVVNLVCGGPGKPKNIKILKKSRIPALTELCSSRVRLGLT
jgi:hypothetical protein